MYLKILWILVYLGTEQSLVKNIEEIIEACKDAQFLILSFNFSDKSILNSILHSNGVYSDIKLNNKLSDPWTAKFDGSLRKVLKKYEETLPKNIVLGGSPGSLRTWLLTQFLSIKMSTNFHKPIRIIVALNVLSKECKIMKDVANQLLNFCKHKETVSKSTNEIHIQILTMHQLIKFNMIKPDSYLLDEALGMAILCNWNSKTRYP